MKKYWQVRFGISGLSPEKLLNEARKRGMALDAVARKQDRRVEVSCASRDYASLRALGEERGFSVSDPEPVGLFKAWRRLLGRPGLLAGIVCCLGLILYAMGFVWQISIENAGAYAGEVRQFLWENQIYPGVRRSEIDLSRLQEALEWRLPQVKWVRMRYEGVVLVIHLEEGVPPPRVETEGKNGHVVAQADGLLLRLTVYAGTAEAKAGDFVREGQVLIRGEERAGDGSVIPVMARGEAWARQWISVQAQSSLKEIRSAGTGNTSSRNVIKTPFFSLSLQDEPSYLAYDREIEVQRLGGAWLPIWLQREWYLETAQEWETRNTEEAKAEAARLALILLQKRLQNQEVVDKWLEFSMIKGDTIVATATAEIRRDLAVPQID